MQRTNEPVDVDQETAGSPNTSESTSGWESGSIRWLVVATAGLAFLMCAWLVQRPPFPLPAISIPTGVSIAVQSGSTGVQDDGNGPLWWISSVPARIGVANDTSEPLVVEVSMLLTNGPCSVSRQVEFNGESHELGEGAALVVASGPIELERYQRLSLPLNLDGEPCAPTSIEPRPLVAAISNLETQVVEP